MLKNLHNTLKNTPLPLKMGEGKNFFSREKNFFPPRNAIFPYQKQRITILRQFRRRCARRDFSNRVRFQRQRGLFLR